MIHQRWGRLRLGEQLGGHVTNLAVVSAVDLAEAGHAAADLQHWDLKASARLAVGVAHGLEEGELASV